MTSVYCRARSWSPRRRRWAVVWKMRTWFAVKSQLVFARNPGRGGRVQLGWIGRGRNAGPEDYWLRRPFLGAAAIPDRMSGVLTQKSNYHLRDTRVPTPDSSIQVPFHESPFVKYRDDRRMIGRLRALPLLAVDLGTDAAGGQRHRGEDVVQPQAVVLRLPPTSASSAAWTFPASPNKSQGHRGAGSFPLRACHASSVAAGWPPNDPAWGLADTQTEHCSGRASS